MLILECLLALVIAATVVMIALAVRNELEVARYAQLIKLFQE